MDANHRKANLRLDTREGALSGGAIVPGNAGGCEVIQRIFSSNPDDQMPPPDSNRRLSEEQKALLRAWVQSGADYDTHWAFKTPVRPEFPPVKQKRWVRNGIDHFILAKLESEKLKPSPEAPMLKLLRRASLDLTGLPPEPEQMKRWLAQRDPYAAALDELLNSPRYGERMAADWMDVARYADTHGFNNDSARSMWRWRDWVIEAFNRNLPYDRFITEQLAGDLLPNPTLDQLIATGFNRNHVINSEGGIIDEEYRVEYVSDRVRTFSMAWMGLTMECARCHDHKFDPITQKDYFSLFAFFNSVNEYGEAGRVANAAPFIPAPTQQQRIEMDKQRMIIEETQRAMMERERQLDWSAVSFDSFLNSFSAIDLSVPEEGRLVDLDLRSMEDNVITNNAGGKPFKVRGRIETLPGPLGAAAVVFDGKTSLKTDALPKGDNKWAFAAWVRRDAARAGVLFSTMNYTIPASSQQHGNGVEIQLREDGAVEVRAARRWPAYSINIVTHETMPVAEWCHLLVVCDGSEKARGMRVFIDGEECGREVLQDDFALSGISGDALIGASTEQGSFRFVGALAEIRLWIKPETVEEIAAQVRMQAIRMALEKTARKGQGETFDTPIDTKAKRAWLVKNDPSFAELEKKWRTARMELLRLQREAPTTMIMQELPEPRATHLLFRGQYDQPREQVQPDVPAFLPPFPDGAPRNRLGLAQWLTAPDHPLTARVVVNRFWQELFGNGIVKTSEDFGFQAEYPSHPELLDWLAREFVDSGWDVKRLLRLMMESATYRQDSRSSEQLNERDPENRLLARGPRLRLTAEMLRDQALALSGLLKEKIGGPAVYPYQPANLYQGIVVAAPYPGTSYTDSTGDDLYRRSLYTFWKRTVPHPTLATFDAPDREVCVARRLKTNTPLQALALMNDTIQLEAAQKLAERMWNEGGRSVSDRIRFGFLIATARRPAFSEQRTLLKLFENRLRYYRNNPESAKQFLSVGASNCDDAKDPAELAALANVASLILNLDETITRN